MIWNNSFITISNRPFTWQQWRAQGILYIKDILDGNGQFMDHLSIQRKFNITCNFLQALQIRQSIPANWRHTLSQNYNDSAIITEPFFVNINNKLIPISESNTKDFYLPHVYKRKRYATCIQKWQNIYPTIDFQWEDVFTHPYKCGRKTRIQSFQYKILHRIINCNKKLFDMKILTSPKCSYCPEIDDISHFFCTCDRVNEFWCGLFAWWNSTEEIRVNYPNFPAPHDIIFGLPVTEDQMIVINFVIIHAKYYIYRQRLFQENYLSVHNFLGELKYNLQIEQKICKDGNTPDKFTKYLNIYHNLNG